MKRVHFLLTTIGFHLALCVLAVTARAQLCDYQNKVTVLLNDGTTVTLYGRASNERVPGTDEYAFTGEYYYLPANLRLATKEDGTPQFLLMKYTSDERTDAGGVQGALTHFLMRWGLTPEQETELGEKLKAKVQELASSNPLFARVSSPRVMGAMDFTAEKDNSFRIISAVMNDRTLTTALIASSKASVLPGNNIATAAMLNQNGAQLMAATLEKSRSIADLSLEMTLKYNLLLPAVRGKITIDWSKVETAFESFRATYRHDDRDTKTGEDDTYSYDEMQQVYTSALETKAVVVEIDKNTTDDAIANKVVEEFMNVMVASLTDKADQEERPAPATEEEKAADPNIRYGSRYRFNKTKMESHRSRKIEVYNLSYRLAIPKEAVITENLATWYDAVRDNPKCVTTMRTTDPFFQYRDINLVLSEGAEQLIGKDVNYVTVNVRKKRSDGSEFYKSVTIDKEYLKKNGMRTNFTYARDNDADNSVFEYQAQWSFNDGTLFPEQARWISGEWEGVPLTLPVRARTIEFESTPDELKAAGITRATLQVAYMKLGKEVIANIPISVAKNESLVKQVIYVDPASRGYAYRLVFNHKEDGKLATEWDAKINDDYVYASIPEAFRDKTSEAFRKAIDSAKEVLEGEDGQPNGATKVLDKFKDVLGIVTN